MRWSNFVVCVLSKSNQNGFLVHHTQTKSTPSHTNIYHIWRLSTKWSKCRTVLNSVATFRMPEKWSKSLPRLLSQFFSLSILAITHTLLTFNVHCMCHVSAYVQTYNWIYVNSTNKNFLLVCLLICHQSFPFQRIFLVLQT